MGLAAVAITTSGSGNCKGTGLCYNWDNHSNWHKEEWEKWIGENKWAGEWQAVNMSLWMTQHNGHSWERPLVQRLALPKKDMTWWTVTSSFCNKERASFWMSAKLLGGKDTDMHTVSQHNPKKQKFWVRWRSDLEKLICYPKWTNKEHKNEWACLPTHLEETRTKMSSKIDNNTETLARAKEHNGFSDGCENPRGSSQPKR